MKKKWLRFKYYKDSESSAWIVQNQKRDELGLIELYRRKPRFEVESSAYSPCWFYEDCLVELAAFMHSIKCRNGLTSHNIAYTKYRNGTIA